MPTEIKRKSDVSIVLFLFIALAVIGLIGGAYFVHDFARARASMSWPTVEGIVLSKLDDERADIRYVYSYDGMSYESTRERWLLTKMPKGGAVDYNPGESVTVYVHPQEHSYAVLYPGGAGLLFVVCSVLSGLSIFFGIGGILWTLTNTEDELFDLASDPA
ncbi:DUF3592 domain-containing protein [Hyphococcus sp. DH-69]|uniref:DUF3592 domain-containing protein n=1 Tax=Hyphococcus formosus TaxID=3143534 RepID=UPI00398AFBBA